MAENTKISWTDHTFNPWVGCTKISPACDNCYAEVWAKRAGSPELWQGQRRRTKPGNWNGPVKWNAEAAKRGIRYRVFCASLADVFDNEVPEGWRNDLFSLIGNTPHLDWLLLTKRIGNVDKMLPPPWTGDNVWLGATVVTQAEADRDVPKLLAQQWPAKLFLSVEPMLEAITLIDVKMEGSSHRTLDALNGMDSKGVTQYERALDWVICGGESGPKARNMNPDWARDLRNQCASADVAFHFKQMSKRAPIPDDLMVREFPQ